MESERRSTMSSLKGQLSNVEGSVKSMKAAVVVGSVLTVACLAAVFGVTILANEVSKEVKVSNGTLTAKNGKAVLTTSTSISDKYSSNAYALEIATADAAMVLNVNAHIAKGNTVTVICDDFVAVQEDGIISSSTVASGSVLESVLANNVEKRNLNSRCPGCGKAIYEGAKWFLSGAMFSCTWGMIWQGECLPTGDDDEAPESNKAPWIWRMEWAVLAWQSC